MGLVPIDFHTHVSSPEDPGDESGFKAVVFAATMTLKAAATALERDDDLTIWGVGCHPAWLRAQKAFDLATFEQLLQRTAYVSEVGLDGKSRVASDVQWEILQQVLSVLRREPRIVSLHCHNAVGDVLRALRQTPTRGVMLHWWQGTPDETRLALDLGCFFSMNADSVLRTDLLDIIPISRILTETDHPAGNEFDGPTRRPGDVLSVEQALGKHYGLEAPEIRKQLWRSLNQLVLDTGVAHLLPEGIAARLATVER
ncbi:putative TatD related DNase family protein [metagenome]|uniref:Putative TatD related DNase family protein n=1 Tax=metagenome TaxID=256318 RepID=A0A2P2C8P3_9ZZZZ